MRAPPPGALDLTRPSPLESLGSVLLGLEPDSRWRSPVLHEVQPLSSPLEELRSVVRRALERPPCIVSFSGGRDSSAVLAVAVDVARREGLALPVPVTKRYRASPESDEQEWQQLVIGHLGLNEWIHVDVGTELDAVGPVASSFMLRNGITVGQLHTSALTFGPARGGSCLDGEGGDEVFGVRRSSAIKRVLHHTVPVRRLSTYSWMRTLLAPRAVRVRAMQARFHSTIECRRWLRPDALERFVAAVVDERTSEPLDARRALAWHLRRRSIVHLRRNLREIAQADYDVVYDQPLLDERFVTSFARMAGPLGILDRTAAMRKLFSELLPDAILARTSKAYFNGVYLGDETRRFAEGWSGGGVDTSLVDVEALRREWLSDWGSTQSCALLQAAWLHDHARDAGSAGG